MRALKLFFCMLPVLYISCSDTTGPGDTGDGEMIAYESVGADGGTLGSEKITVSIPAGAFENENSIALTTAPEHPFSDETVSETYMISGLPQSYQEELTVSIAVPDTASEDWAVAVGVNTWVSSYGETAMTYTMLPADVSGAIISAVLPAAEFTAAKSAITGEETSSTITVTAVAGYKPHVTANGHFKIDYSTRFTTRASVEQLGLYLEEAYDTISGLGFSYNERTVWPLSVLVKDIGTKDGAASNSIWGDNYGYIEINRNIMDDSAKMRATAGHEFFHVVQSLYDPRNFYSKAKLEAPHLWLDEACSVWVEEKFSDTQKYVSGARQGNELAPFNGVVAGAANDAGEHGYGLSGMIKYLVSQYGESCILKMYEQLKGGSSAMASVILATTSPVEWWEDFLRQYVLGDIYGMGIPQLTANREGMFRVISESDSLETFTAEYPDLSGKLYVIRLEDESFDENATLSLSVEGGMGEVTAIKYRLDPLNVEFVGTGTEEVTVSGLKSLTDSGWHVIALVSNSRSIDPYTENSTIKLTCRVKAPVNPGFNFFSLHPELIGDFEHISYVDSAYNRSYTTVFFPASSPYGYGTLNGTTFSGTRGENGDKTISGTFTIEFDDTFQNILSIEAAQTSTTPGKNGSGDSFHNVTFNARNIPLYQIDGTDYNFRLIGDEITDQVTSMTFEYGIVGDRKTTLVDYRGGGGSDISIWLRIQ